MSRSNDPVVPASPGRVRAAGARRPGTRRGGPTPALVTLGDLLLDVVVVAAREPERGTDVPGSLRFRAGGSAANAARAFARLGGRASLIGAVGRDDWGRLLVRALREEGVTVRAVPAGAVTGRLLAIVDRTGERSFVTERAAADLLRPEDIRPGWLRGAGALHVPAYSLFHEPAAAAAARAAELAHEAGALVSVDLASRRPLLAFGREAAAERIDALRPAIILANRGEAAAMTGTAAARGRARLLDLAPLVVVKDGSAGCAVLWRAADGSDGELDVVASPVAAEDTTGAGDAFAAGFLHSLLGGAAGVGGEAPSRPWSPAVLRRAALAGHRAAADLLRRPRAELRG